MSKKIYILHHLGLGDHFHCNGVVRFLLKEKYKDTKVLLFAKQKYLEMVQFMYRDMHNLKVIPISNDEKIEQEEINSYLNEGDKIERIGFYYFLKNKHKNKTIDVSDLDVDDMLLLEDGHCFRDGVINLCKAFKNQTDETFQLESGSIETLIRLSNEGLGMTLLPYLHTLEINEKEKENLRHFNEPSPAREVSLIYHKSELKMQIIEALQDVISGVVRGAIAFQNVKIISPLPK